MLKRFIQKRLANVSVVLMIVVVVIVVAVVIEVLGRRCLVMVVVAFARGSSKLVTCGG